MGLLAIIYVEDKIYYACKQCGAHLTSYDELISRDYTSSNGRAFLFNNVINVICGHLEDKAMTSGLHTVCDIYCTSCQSKLGWKYEIAHDEKNKFKEGRYILEKVMIKKITEKN